MQQSSAKTTACSRTRVVNLESCGRWQASRNFVQLISCAGHMQPSCYILNLWNFDDPVDHLDWQPGTWRKCLKATDPQWSWINIQASSRKKCDGSIQPVVNPCLLVKSLSLLVPYQIRLRLDDLFHMVHANPWNLHTALHIPQMDAGFQCEQSGFQWNSVNCCDQWLCFKVLFLVLHVGS